MLRQSLLRSGCLLLASASFAFAAKAPNFVFILADDLGKFDLGIEGSTFHETPHIDRLAKSSMRFENGYSASRVCSPSRASILLGKTPARHGVTNWIGAKSGMAYKRNDPLMPAQYTHNLPAEDITIAEALRDNGYSTMFVGKWHLGSEGSWPEDHGFSINKGGWTPGYPKGGYYAPWDNPRLESGPAGESLTMRLAEEAASFIEAHQDEPFLVFFSFYQVHGPIETTEALCNKYRAKAEQMGLTQHSERFKFEGRLPVRQVRDNPIYAGMMETFDDAIGVVMEKLKETGLDENTVVIFTSDNGGLSSGGSYPTSALPFRGGKGRPWEGGIRQPYYIRVPGMTAAGDRTDTFATGMDFYPTMLELAGLPAMPEQHVDGVSLVPVLQGKELEARDLYWHYPHYGNQGGEPSSVIRSGDWKLVEYHEDGRSELYNLANDMGEQTDLAAQNPERVASLKVKLDAWLVDTGAVMPKPDPRFNEAKYLQKIKRNQTTFMDTLEDKAARFLDPNWVPNRNWWGSSAAN